MRIIDTADDFINNRKRKKKDEVMNYVRLAPIRKLQFRKEKEKI